MIVGQNVQNLRGANLKSLDVARCNQKGPIREVACRRRCNWVDQRTFAQYDRILLLPWKIETSSDSLLAIQLGCSWMPKLRRTAALTDFCKVQHSVWLWTTTLLEYYVAISSQCYKHFTGLHLQVCKNRAIFKMICGYKWCLIQNYHALLLKGLVLKRENRHQNIAFDST